MRRLSARRADGTPDPTGVAAAVAALAAGELVILPTDTVYGIAADGSNAAAIAHLFEAKDRPRSKTIALLVASTGQAATVADLTAPVAQRLMSRWWPGALTIVSRAIVALPEGVIADGRVGVRLPDDPVVQAVAAGLGRPLAVTSANRSGEDAVATFDEAVRELADWVAVALDGGPCPIGVASTVVDLSSPEPVVLRQGSARPF